MQQARDSRSYHNEVKTYHRNIQREILGQVDIHIQDTWRDNLRVLVVDLPIFFLIGCKHSVALNLVICPAERGRGGGQRRKIVAGFYCSVNRRGTPGV